MADAYAAGQSYKEIARELGLSPTTVRSHLRTVYGKLGVTSKIELARFLTDETAPDATRDTGELAAEMALELDEADYREFVLPHVRRIFDGLSGVDVPQIHFGTATGHLLAAQREIAARLARRQRQHAALSEPVLQGLPQHHDEGQQDADDNYFCRVVPYDAYITSTLSVVPQ